MEDKSTGHAAPTPIPIVIGNAAEKVINPFMESACKIPTEADALCKIAVITIPIKIPRIGFENIVSTPVKAGFSLRGDTALLMLCMPIIKMANPSIISPRFLYTSFFIVILKIIPTMATIAEIVAVDRRVAIPSEPSI